MISIKKLILKFVFSITFLLIGKVSLLAQLCAGSWALQRPLTSQCVSGQWIGWQNMTEPAGCPMNPIYIGTQVNTFTFDTPVSGFSIDFKGLDGNPLCARIEVKINGTFYHLLNANISEFPTGSTCTTGSFSYLAVTSDGYITPSINGGEGFIAQGRITINGVNASTVTISTNDGFGTTFSNPFNCTSVVPLKLESFMGIDNNCDILLSWKTGTEFNIKNIQVQQSADGILFHEIGEVNPKGNNSDYSFSTAALSDSYFMLKTNDLDGNYQYSEIIYIKSTCNTAIYQIIPNPAADFIEIVGLKRDDEVLITDMAGRRVLYFDAPVTNKLNVQSLAAGMYFIQVINKGIQIAIPKLIKR